MSKNNLKKIINSDLNRYGVKKINYRIFRTLHGYRYTSIMRKAKYYKNRNKFLYFYNRIKLEYMGFKYGYQIPYYTEIGPGFYIGHFGTIVINGSAKLGNNVNISPGVTIGMTNRGALKGVPNIGNKVWIGTNAVIVGGIKIGNNVMIAPNAFVNFNVPDNSIVIGNPGIIHKKENATEFYVEHLFLEGEN